MDSKISFADCADIIKNDGRQDFHVENYQIIPLDTKLGFLGEYFKLTITFLNGKREERKFFVKTVAMAESQNRFVMANGAVAKEEVFYSKFIPKCLKNNAKIIQECISKCYLIRNMDFFVFDDLSLDGYENLDGRNCLSLRHVKVALKAIAKFHAASYILEETLTEKHKKIYRISDDFNEYLHEAIYADTDVAKEFMITLKTGVRAHIELLQNHLNGFKIETFIKNICDMVDDYKTYVKPSKKYRNVLCHGDLWITNIMYKHENNIPVGFKIIDFQTYRYCPPTLDVVTFLYFCTDRKFRKEHFDDCIDFYLDELKTVLSEHRLDLETIFPRKDFMDCVEYYKKFAVCQASTYGHLTMIDRKLLSDILSDDKRICEVMFKDRRPVMTKMWGKDSVYRQKLFEMLKDLIDVGFCNNDC